MEQEVRVQASQKEEVMEDYEELQRMLAEFVVWTRGSVICPLHGHVTEILLTREGPVEWHGPWCESPAGREVRGECEWRLHRDELVERACETLGTKDMSNFL